MTTRETFIIGSSEYAASKIAPFAANGIILKLQKIILPALGEVMGDGKDKKADVLEMDVSAIFGVLSSKLDDSVMSDIVLPMFKLAQVACLTKDGEKKDIKIDSASGIDKVFVDADGLAEFYELIFEVLKYEFGGFFASLVARFGNKGGAPLATQ